MVDAIRSKAARCEATNVVAVQAGFLSYAHGGDLVDAVYSRNALHHLPDLWKAIALRRMADLLVGGGTLRLRDLVFSFDAVDTTAGIERWIDETASDSPTTGWTRAELEAHVRGEYSTFTWLLEPMLIQAGFEIVERCHAPIGAYADYTCMKINR